jgi:uncharacterized protein YdaU (DUF1376 family)
LAFKLFLAQRNFGGCFTLIPEGFIFFMSKDPAFLFYSSDFLTGTTFMSLEQIGLYIKMLCLQHQHNGRIPTEELRMQCERIANGDAVFKKFTHDGLGSYNERLQIEMKKRSEKGIKARQSANKRWNKNKNNDVCDRIANAMRSENENVNENIIDLNKNSNENENWNFTKKNFFNDFRWKEKFCIDKGLKMDQLEAMQKEFIQTIELSLDFKNKKELYHHFTYWALKNKIKKNDKHSKASRGAYQLIEELRAARTEDLSADDSGTGN